MAMHAGTRLIICAIGFLFFLAAGIFWANAEPTLLGPGQRLAICLVIGALLAILLFFMLPREAGSGRVEPAAHRDEPEHDEFVAGISHEIRTPLAGILGVMHLLKRTALDRNQRRYVDTATNSANMLLAIINDLLASSRTDTGGFLVESERLDLTDVIEDVTSILAAEALSKGLELVCDVDPGIPQRVRGDPLRLHQVLHNLLNNAIKYTDAGIVVVYVKSYDQVIEVGVRDTGVGLSAEQQARLMSADSSDDSGLGLDSCKRLVKAMDSRLQLESEPGKGSRFYFSLKVDATDRAAYDWRPPRALRQLSVGIMSPIALQRSTIRNMLVHWKISDIHELDYDVEQPIDLAALSPCDLLIIDQTDSERAVNDLIDRLRNSSAWRETRFVHLVPQNRQGEKGSADLRLYKPLSHSRLYTAVMDVVYKLAYDSEYGDTAAIPGSAIAGVLAGRRILLAEDNDINKMIVLEILEETGVDVDVAVNGVEVLELLQRQHYDLLLMDVQMPVMDGYEATRGIRALGGRFESIPIIAMTAHALEGDSDKSLEVGMNYHVAKPFEPDELIALIVRYIEQHDA